MFPFGSLQVAMTVNTIMSANTTMTFYIYEIFYNICSVMNLYTMPSV